MKACLCQKLEAYFLLCRMRDEWTFLNDRRRTTPQTEKGPKVSCGTKPDWLWLNTIETRRPQHQLVAPNWRGLSDHYFKTHSTTHLSQWWSDNTPVYVAMLDETHRTRRYLNTQTIFWREMLLMTGVGGCSTIGSSRKHSDNNRNLQRFFSWYNFRLS